ncbi:MAG: hypothetical protein ABIP55_13490 [Tepidisphaeraceae bacterium]
MTYHTQSKEAFRRRLLAADEENPALRAQYDRRIKAMFEVTLSKPKKAWFACLTLFCVVGGGAALQQAITEKLPPAARMGLLLGAAFSAAWAFYLIRILRHGTMQMRIDPPAAAGMGFVFSLLMCVLFAVSEMPADKVVLAGMLFLLPAGLILLRTVIEQAEMRTQERIVELEYKIARLSEKLGDDDDLLGTGVR